MCLGWIGLPPLALHGSSRTLLWGPFCVGDLQTQERAELPLHRGFPPPVIQVARQSWSRQKVCTPGTHWIGDHGSLASRRSELW